MQKIALSDESWARIVSYLPEYKPSSKGGRPRLDLRKVFEGILFVKANRLQWRETPKEFGAKTTLNDYFRQWKEHGVFQKIQQEKLFLVCGQADLHAIDFENSNSPGGEQ